MLLASRAPYLGQPMFWQQKRAKSSVRAFVTGGEDVLDVITHCTQVQCGVQRIGVNGPEQPMYCPDMDEYVIHAFVATFDGAQHMRDLGALPGYPDTYATAIAEDGTIVGYSGTKSGPKWTRVSGPSHAWMWYRGRMVDLGRGTDDNSYAYGVNDRGVIVGCAGDHAVRWVDKRM